MSTALETPPEAVELDPLAEAEALVEAEADLWARAGEHLAALAALFDESVPLRAELEAARASLSPEERARVRGALPWTPDPRSFIVFAVELALNPMKRSYYSTTGDARVEAVPDLTHRILETHAPTGVDAAYFWRWAP